MKMESVHRLGSTRLGSSSVERYLGILVDIRLIKSEQCAAAATKKANKGITSRDKSLSYSTQCLSDHAWNTVFCFGSHYTKKDRLERVQRRAPKMSKGLGSLPYEERLRELGLFSPQKRRLRGDLITMFQYLKGGYKECGDSLFTRSHMGKMRDNGYKLLVRRFRLDARGKLFTMRNISCWNNLPREVVNSPTLDTFKIWLDTVLGHLV